MRGTIHLNGFTQCSVCPQSKGQWKHPLDRSSTGYRDLEYYAEIARTLERGRFDALFFADIHGTYDAYRGSREAAVRHAVQFPCNDPTVLIPALAMITKKLGFATTYSTTYHPPYQCAKLFSTLDHLTGGRVGWNVVTSGIADSQGAIGLDFHRAFAIALEKDRTILDEIFEDSVVRKIAIEDSARQSDS